MVPAIDIPSPTKILFATPIPPDTFNAPVVVDVEEVVSVTDKAQLEVTAPVRLPLKYQAVRTPVTLPSP